MYVAIINSSEHGLTLNYSTLFKGLGVGDTVLVESAVAASIDSQYPGSFQLLDATWSTEVVAQGLLQPYEVYSEPHMVRVAEGYPYPDHLIPSAAVAPVEAKVPTAESVSVPAESAPPKETAAYVGVESPASDADLKKAD